MWSSRIQIKQNVANFKKFYTFLLEQQLVEKENLKELKETIKHEMSSWLENIEEYNNSFDDYF